MWYSGSSSVPRRGILRRSLGFCTFVLAVVAVAACIAEGQQTVPAGFQAYPLRHRRAADVVPQLRHLLEGVAGQSAVLADEELNRLLVQGPAHAQKLVADFVQAMDEPVAAWPAKDDGAVEVKGYPVAGGDLNGMIAELQAEFGKQASMRIAGDERTRQVIVAGPPAVQQQIAKRIAMLAPPPSLRSGPAAPPSAPSQPAYQLRNITWRELEDELQRIWANQLSFTVARNGEVSTIAVATAQGPEPVLEVDRRRGQVRSVAPTASASGWIRVVRTLDSPRVTPDQQTRLVPIRNADPAKVQSAVSMMRPASYTGDGEVTSATRRLNRGRAPRWGGDLVSMVFRRDGEAAPAAAAPAAAAPAAPAGEAPAVPGQAAAEGAMAEGGAEEGGGLIGPVQIDFLEGLDMIVVRGNKRDVERVMKIIDDIERLSAQTQPVVEVYPMQHVSGEAMADLITAVYGEILSPRQGSVTIRALVDPNAILLIGRAESVAVVKDLIAKLDQPAVPAGQSVVFRLKHVSAIDAETTVRNFFTDRPGVGNTIREGTGVQVRVIADYRSNSLIVQASARDMAEVKRLIEGIDVEEVGATAAIRVFRLKNALAQDLADVLRPAITGQTTGQAGQAGQAGVQTTAGAAGGATQARATPFVPSLEFMMVDQQGGRLLRSGVMTNVQITADPSINALVVRAPAKSMELIAALIDQLDKLPDVQAQIKVFEVVNGDATNLAVVLQQLFGQAVTAGTTGGLFGGGLAGLLQPPAQTAAAGGESSLVPLRFSVDIRSNSIIASGSEGDLNVVEALLLRLDLGELESRKLTVIRLKNAPATDVANAITTFLTNQRTLIQQRLLTSAVISPYEQIEQEVIVVAEPVTNSLIISATPRYYDQVMQVIKELDFRPPMVMVQVLIAEVKLDNTSQFGVEWGLQDALLFDRGIATTPASAHDPGFNFNNVNLPNLNAVNRSDLGAQGLTTFGLGRTNPTLGYGGLVLSAASDTVNIMLRALQDEGRLQVLSRPQVMTLHNQDALIQVGATQSRITGTTITATGIVQNNVTDVDTGLIVRITPLINDDDVVVMTLDAERSFLGEDAEGPTVAFGPDNQPIRSPPINRTLAQATLSARSGQTVVFAGLITKSKATDLRQVPYLCDIPVLGKLFEHRTDVELRTELLIIMTPHIIREDADYEWIKMIESERMSWCLADVVEVNGDVGLQGGSCLFCDDDVPVIFPDADPMGGHFGGNEATRARTSSDPGPLPQPPLPEPESARRGQHSGPAAPEPPDQAGPASRRPIPAESGIQALRRMPQTDPTYRTTVSYGPVPSNVRPAQYAPPPNYVGTYSGSVNAPVPSPTPQ